MLVQLYRMASFLLIYQFIVDENATPREILAIAFSLWGRWKGEGPEEEKLKHSSFYFKAVPSIYSPVSKFTSTELWMKLDVFQWTAICTPYHVTIKHYCRHYRAAIANVYHFDFAQQQSIADLAC